MLAGVCSTMAASSSFGYAVSDPMTGDHKDQQEVRAGDAVAGYYRMLDADGLMRTVHYRADPLTGFTADVDRSPAAVAAAKIVTRPAAIMPVAKTLLAAEPAVSTISHVYKSSPTIMAAAPSWHMWNEPKPAVMAKFAPFASPLDWEVPVIKK